jgi:predicted PolB exonuclease-like 3'-5' exonuclease
MVETNDVIQLYVRSPGLISIDFILYAMIELDIDKKLEVYEKVHHIVSNYEKSTVEFNGSYYDLRYADYRDSIILKVYFFRALYFANFLNRPELYRKILEMGGKRHFDHVKMLLNDGGSYINSVECRRELIEFINSHTIKEDISL